MSGVIGGPTPPEYLSAYEKVMDLVMAKILIKRQLIKKLARLTAWGTNNYTVRIIL
ncbi:MAG: hypothetical protein ACLRZ2_08050 [Veillonella sp.]